MSSLKTYAEITEQDVKKIYDDSPDVNQMFTWPEVLAYVPMYLILKNQVPHQQPVRETLVTGTMPKSSRIFYGLDLAPRPDVTRSLSYGTPLQENSKKRSVLILPASKVQRLVVTLNLLRTCLQFGGVSDAVKSEALDGLQEFNKQFNDFLKQKHQ